MSYAKHVCLHQARLNVCCIERRLTRDSFLSQHIHIKNIIVFDVLERLITTLPLCFHFNKLFNPHRMRQKHVRGQCGLLSCFIGSHAEISLSYLKFLKNCDYKSCRLEQYRKLLVVIPKIIIIF